MIDFQDSGMLGVLLALSAAAFAAVVAWKSLDYVLSDLRRRREQGPPPPPDPGPDDER